MGENSVFWNTHKFWNKGDTIFWKIVLNCKFDETSKTRKKLLLGYYLRYRTQWPYWTKGRPNLVRHSIVASIPACHAGDRGSIPRDGEYVFLFAATHNLLFVLLHHFFGPSTATPPRSQARCTFTIHHTSCQGLATAWPVVSSDERHHGIVLISTVRSGPGFRMSRWCFKPSNTMSGY